MKTQSQSFAAAIIIDFQYTYASLPAAAKIPVESSYSMHRTALEQRPTVATQVSVLTSHIFTVPSWAAVRTRSPDNMRTQLTYKNKIEINSAQSSTALIFTIALHNVFMTQKEIEGKIEAKIFLRRHCTCKKEINAFHKKLKNIQGKRRKFTAINIMYGSPFLFFSFFFLILLGVEIFISPNLNWIGCNSRTVHI